MQGCLDEHPEAPADAEYGGLPSDRGGSTGAHNSSPPVAALAP